jgi:dihydroneopterin aldolase
MNKPVCSLSLEQLKVPVLLGVDDSELQTPQLIEIDIKIMFYALPKACLTDQLNDTVCYAHLTERIEEFCSEKIFYLIEHLGYQLYRWLKEVIKQADIGLTIKKTPPIDNLAHSVFFIGDGTVSC